MEKADTVKGREDTHWFPLSQKQFQKNQKTPCKPRNVKVQYFLWIDLSQHLPRSVCGRINSISLPVPFGALLTFCSAVASSVYPEASSFSWGFNGTVSFHIVPQNTPPFKNITFTWSSFLLERRILLAQPSPWLDHFRCPENCFYMVSILFLHGGAFYTRCSQRELQLAQSKPWKVQCDRSPWPAPACFPSRNTREKMAIQLLTSSLLPVQPFSTKQGVEDTLGAQYENIIAARLTRTA